MRTVYIQQVDGRFLRGAQYGISLAFQQFGYEVRTFERMELEVIPRDPTVVVVGGIGAVRAALARLGREPLALADLPDSLAEYRGRRVWRSTLGAVRALASGPLFVKPLRVQKAFKGHVVSAFRDLIATAAQPDALEVLVADAIPLQSEWRTYVLRGEVLGCHHYHGDPLMFPDAARVRAMVETYQRAGAPAAYGLDVGVTAAGTLLVEVNDGYSLGNYGVPELAYARMLEARWDEMTSVGTPAAAAQMTLPEAPT